MASSVEVKTSKTFPKVRDRNEYLKHPDVAQAALMTLPDPARSPLLDPLEQMPDFLSGLKHRARSGFNDPLSVALVLDALIHSFPAAYVRATYLTLWLNRNRSDFIWEPITVGRILGEIVDVSAETFAGSEPLPVDRGTDWRGHYMVIDPDGGATGRLWLMKLLSGLVRKCEEVVEDEEDGVVAARNGSVWADVETGA
jgi:hypothetical protein